MMTIAKRSDKEVICIWIFMDLVIIYRLRKMVLITSRISSQNR